MSRVQDYLHMPNYRNAYVQGMTNNQQQNFGQWNYDDGSHTPLYISSTADASIQLRRANDVNPYSVSLNPQFGPHMNRKFQNCVERTNNPGHCIKQTTGPYPHNWKYAQM
jgi:hypothetical protein